MELNLPSSKNPKLAKLLKRVEQDESLDQMYKCVNINAVDRLGMPDHGPVHIKIVINIALKLLRLLHKNNIQTGIEKNYGMTFADSEIVTFLAALLHDIGMVVHRSNHEEFSIMLAPPIIDRLLQDYYTTREQVIIKAEVLHAIYAHQAATKCLTLEAGVVKVADALDMNEGRSRISFEAGEVNIHSVSSLAIKEVKLLQGEKKPVRIEIVMTNSAGIFQIDELLKRKLQGSSIRDLVEICALIEGEAEKKIVSFYEM